METKELMEAIRSAGLTPEEYLEWMTRQAAADPGAATAEEAELIEYTKLNLRRTQRIDRTWDPSTEMIEAVGAISSPQLWMVLTEPWCGDSAQCLPYAVKLASANPDIEMKFVLRDSHPEIMDRFLTNGSRSIPRLVAFAADGTVLGQWGPRPVAAQEVFTAAKQAGLEKPEILEKLHLWYGRNRGAAVADELLEFVHGLGAGASNA